MINEKQDFDIRNEEKKLINIRSTYPRFIKPKEIWYCKLGKNIGDEENGKQGWVRPVLIIKKIGSLYFVLPLSTKLKESIYYYPLKTSSIMRKESSLLLSQGRVIDSKRLTKHIGHIQSDEFYVIKKILRDMYL